MKDNTWAVCIRHCSGVAESKNRYCCKSRIRHEVAQCAEITLQLLRTPGFALPTHPPRTAPQHVSPVLFPSDARSEEPCPSKALPLGFKAVCLHLRPDKNSMKSLNIDSLCENCHLRPTPLCPSSPGASTCRHTLDWHVGVLFSFVLPQRAIENLTPCVIGIGTSRFQRLSGTFNTVVVYQT